MTKLNRKKVKDAINDCFGNYSVIANRCNVSRSAICRFFYKHPDLREMADKDRLKLVDLAEKQVAIRIKAGDARTCKWFLDAQGKERGYGQKLSIEGNINKEPDSKFNERMEKIKKLPKEQREIIMQVLGLEE
jgi:hypothetical protein